jgi:hypothetical protein
MAVAIMGVLVSGASADIVTERSASVLVFPKVIANGTRDTLIQITNTSNSMVHAHCFYVNAAPTFRDLPPDPIDNPPLWQEIDFDIWLTKQQPTYWRVSTGRQVDADDSPCDFVSGRNDCPNAGLDPGAVPPVVEDFVGELKCVETDQTGAPISGNHLKGEATVITFDVCDPNASVCTVGGGSCDPLSTAPQCTGGDFDSAKYNAIGILGNEFNNGDSRLCLGGQPNDDCQDGAEYNGCPRLWHLNHFATDTESPVYGEGSSIDTSITAVPCSQNYETQIPSDVTLQMITWDEFETPFSSSYQFTCWTDVDLRDISNVFDSPRGSTYMHTQIRSTDATAGVMLVATESHRDSEDGRTGSASFNVHHEGTRAGQDLITIPAEQIQ